MNKPTRQPYRQQFFPFAVQCDVAAVPLNNFIQQATLTALYTSIAFSVPVGGLSCIWGDSSVLLANGNGMFITPGIVQVWKIDNGGRQLYELQEPLIDGMQCAGAPLSIPLAVWDVSTIWVASSAPQTLGVMLFQEGFV